MTAEFQMREDMFRLLDILKNKYPEFKNCSISASAVNAGIREGRHLVGVHTLTGDEIMRAEHFEDSVARNAHPIDMHCADGSSQVLQELSEAGYIPYRSLISPEADNVIVCGRAISADDAAHASIRVQATGHGRRSGRGYGSRSVQPMRLQRASAPCARAPENADRPKRHFIKTAPVLSVSKSEQRISHFIS